MPTPKKSRPVEPLTYDPELAPDYYAQVPRTILLDQSISDGALRLYSVLLLYCRRKAEAWPGQETLAEDMGRSIRQVHNLLSQLRDIGLVDWQQNGQSSNRYHVYKAPLIQRSAKTEAENSDRKNISTLDRKDISTLDRKDISTPDRQLISTESHESEQHEIEEQQQHTDADAALLDLLKQEGISPKTSEKLAKILKYNGRTADYIQDWKNHIALSDDIRRPQGFLRRMIEENANVPQPISAEDRRKAENAKRLASFKRFNSPKPVYPEPDD